MNFGEFKRLILSIPPKHNGKDLVFVGVDNTDDRPGQFELIHVDENTIAIMKMKHLTDGERNA